MKKMNILQQHGIMLMGPAEDKEEFAKLLIERGGGNPCKALKEMKPGDILQKANK